MTIKKNVIMNCIEKTICAFKYIISLFTGCGYPHAVIVTGHRSIFPQAGLSQRHALARAVMLIQWCVEPVGRNKSSAHFKQTKKQKE